MVSKKKNVSNRHVVDTSATNLSAGELLRFASAMIVASGAAYLLGYLGQIDTYLFSYLSAGDFLNAAIVYLPVSLILAILNGLQIFLRERTIYSAPLFEDHWKRDDGEWGKKTRFRIQLAAFTSVLLLAGVLALPLRFNFDMNPWVGLLCTLIFLAVFNEVYRYGEERYGWSIRNFSLLLSAFYFLVTSIFIGAIHAQVHENLLHYRSILILQNENNVCTTAYKKLGERLLFYDVETSEWQTVKLSDIERTHSLGDAKFVLDVSCNAVVENLQLRKVTSFSLTRPIEETDLKTYQEPANALKSE